MLGWQLALVLVFTMPVLIACSYEEVVVLRSSQLRDTRLLDKAGKVNCSAIQSDIDEYRFYKKEQTLRTQFRIKLKQVLALSAKKRHSR